MLSANSFSKTACSIALVSILSACGGSVSDDGTIDGDTGGTPPPSNRAPSISGNPPSMVVAGQAFSFAPAASDPDGDSLSFTIQNRPAWVTSFNASSGQMAGTPDSSDVGVYQNITVTVSDGELSSSLSPFSVEVDDQNNNPPPPGNSAPTISGSPSGTTMLVGESCSFSPSASDPDGDSLTFSIQGRPSWLTFNSTNGRLSGTPGAGDVGTYNNIRISVSDGSLSDTLSAFSVTVNQATSGNVTLQWDAPTQNTDGSALTDLAGYAFYYGSSPGTYPNRIQVSNAGITSYVVENLSPGTYYFVAVAIKASGVESAFSNEAVKVVQ